MTHPLLRAARVLSAGTARAASIMAYLAGWNYVACAIFITADVLGRSFLGVSSAATIEITGYMLAGGIAWGLAHALARRAHIRVDALVNRLPARPRAVLHILALSLLGAFAVFSAWAGWTLLDESLLFDAHDNSALHIPLALPQGLWVFGLAAFCVMIMVLLLEAVLGLVLQGPAAVDALLGPRGLQDETEEALEAIAMARRAGTAP
ncbi:TRAP transporter small permease [Roseomonas sp. SSH11]|uniref:TRAP transporter small permease protein n=1 Tax=Pararoseomonas baculiformis TaxID=2820812 RepID=A0ABS4ALC2_9PROT|nr:TRAP transporter small permease [Pararoseomonas baculiformis]MBP0447671.1 TRAP transporter small permease [Pararoseomonas baculiformis]